MQLSVRRFTPADHPILSKWWSDWNFPIILLPQLPQFGLIISNENADICAGFCYRTDSAYALVEYFVSNKQFKDRKIKKTAFDRLFTELEEYARKCGHLILSTNIHSKERSFQKRLKDNAFFQGDTNMINFLKKI